MYYVLRCYGAMELRATTRQRMQSIGGEFRITLTQPDPQILHVYGDSHF